MSGLGGHMMRDLGLVMGVVLALAGCRGLGVKDEASTELERTFLESEVQVRESRTRSSLIEMESALSSFVKQERRIPDKLDELIPKYMAAIPAVDIGAGGHRETSDVKYYRSDLLRDGQIDGTKLQDSGKWAYVHNDRQVVIFVDCTHPNSRGRPWYQERGAQ